jgi:hypothetical protein
VNFKRLRPLRLEDLQMTLKIGDPVWYRSNLVSRDPDRPWSLRGVIEKTDASNAPYGVRLENGNHAWAMVDEVKPRETPQNQ